MREMISRFGLRTQEQVADERSEDADGKESVKDTPKQGGIEVKSGLSASSGDEDVES